MQFIMYQDAPEGSIFTEGAFNAQIGRLVPLTLQQSGSVPSPVSIGHARLLTAEILLDGDIARLTLEICPDNSQVAKATADAIFKTGLPAMSFVFKD
jgi:hypothetical protein